MGPENIDRRKTILYAVLVFFILGILLVSALANHPQFSTINERLTSDVIAGRYSWLDALDVVAEGTFTLLAFSWIIIIHSFEENEQFSFLMLLGAALLSIGFLTDFLGEFIPGWEVFDLFENVMGTGGMVVLTFGVYALIRYLRERTAILEWQVDQRTAELRDSLGQKDAMIQEVHHRTKNTLQMISSIVSLESQAVTSDDALRAMASVQSRLHAISLVHENALQAEEEEMLNMRSYLEGLVSYAEVGYAPTERGLSVHAHIDELVLPVSVGLPLGIIASETLAQAINNDFPRDMRGTVELCFTAEDGEGILEVKDDGVRPDTPTAETTPGMGIVQVLADQIDGTLSVAMDGGTTVTVRFTLPDCTSDGTSPD